MGHVNDDRVDEDILKELEKRFLAVRDLGNEIVFNEFAGNIIDDNVGSSRTDIAAVWNGYE